MKGGKAFGTREQRKDTKTAKFGGRATVSKKEQVRAGRDWLNRNM